MTPGSSDRTAAPLSSSIGSASRSARRNTVGPGRVPRSTVTTDDDVVPSVTSTGRPARASRTVRWLRGQFEPDLRMPVQRLLDAAELIGERGGLRAPVRHIGGHCHHDSASTRIVLPPTTLRMSSSL